MGLAGVSAFGKSCKNRMSVSRCDGLKRDKEPRRSSSVGVTGSRSEDGEDDRSMVNEGEIINLRVERCKVEVMCAVLSESGIEGTAQGRHARNSGSCSTSMFGLPNLHPDPRHNGVEFCDQKRGIAKDHRLGSGITA
jgi:hypothetical protein